jgi:predicted transcriptional regulator
MMPHKTTTAKPLKPHSKPVPPPDQEPIVKDRFGPGNPFYNELKESGCNRREIKTLIYLLGQQEPKTRPEIQEETGMKQTDVSQATRALVDNGWVNVTKQQTKTDTEFKGGPKFSLFQIAVSREGLCKDLEKVLDGKIRKIEAVRKGLQKHLGVKKEQQAVDDAGTSAEPAEKPHQLSTVQSASGQSGQRPLSDITVEPPTS